MFSEGNLLYFAPFKFKNGAMPKNKYFLVLKNTGNGLLLASLPTSKDHIPADMPVRSGAYEFPERGFSAYVFLAGEEIATEPSGTAMFSFPRNTFLYGEQLDTYPVSSLLNLVNSGAASVTVVAKLEQSIMDKLYDYIRNSCTVRGKFKKMLPRLSAFEQSSLEAKEGKVFKAENAEDMIKQILE